MNKKLLIGTGVYLIFLLVAIVFLVFRGGPNYITYKDTVKAAQASVDSKPKVQSDYSNSLQGSELANKEVKKENATTSIAAVNNDKAVVPVTPSTTATTTTKPEEDYSTVVFTTGLGLGSNGIAVKKVQDKLLQKKLYSGDISGIYDAATVKAVKSFQQNSKLVQDGIIGQETWKKLME